MYEQSFGSMKLVHQDILQSRIEFVKELKKSDNGSYSIVKDAETGEHYIHFVYLHIDVAGSGEEEWLHHFLPVENDDVLQLLFEDVPYEYPNHWNHAYMRGGPNGGYVWFDPTANSEYEEMEALGREITERMKDFKEKGARDPDSIRKLLDEMDRL